MSRSEVRPSTIPSVKRLAKRISRQDGITHSIALDQASKQAGFQNFRHARKIAPMRRIETQEHVIYVSSYWRDEVSGTAGRESLVVKLQRPLVDIVSKNELSKHMVLPHFKFEGPDHLVRKSFLPSERRAREKVCETVRTLQFMDVTRLRPLAYRPQAFPEIRENNRLPGMDHSQVWFDANAQKRLISDEPYPMSNETLEERSAWAAINGYRIVMPVWPGMYYPEGGSQLFLIAKEEDGTFLDDTVAALSRLPPPISAEDWSGDSTNVSPRFISPGRKLEIDARKSNAAEKQKRKPPSLVRRGNTVAYNMMFVGEQRRPNARMPIETHLELGRMIKSILVATERRTGVFSRLNAVRSELDEWVQREYKRDELSDAQLSGMYFGEKTPMRFKVPNVLERNQFVTDIQNVEQSILSHYPDCRPRDLLLNKLQRARKSLAKWRV